MTGSNLLSSRIYFFIHSWRNNWSNSSKLITRYRTTRYILCSSTLPLCFINRSSIRHHGRTHSLISTIYRILTKSNSNKDPILSNIYRSKYNILPSTLPGPIWYTASILRLSRRFHTMKYNFIYWINYLTNRCIYITLHCMRSYDMQTKPINATRKKNSCGVILRYTTTIPYPYRTDIHIKQHIRTNP